MRENARSSRRALQGARETEAALVIAGQNADAATSMVKVSEENAEKGLRAYVSFGKVKIVDGPAHEDPAKVKKSFQVEVWNKGATPAYQTRIAYSVLIDGEDCSPVDSIFENAVIAANDFIKYDALVITGTDVWPKIESGGAIIDITVFVNYMDVFKCFRRTNINLRAESDRKVAKGGCYMD